ncbi:MAG: hypothetical protein IPK82_31320 [Polyangiaceae bacterium]|nr:hypothetical protein [Polyangiaceae bacterium]
MATVNILVAVNVTQAIATGNLGANVFMMDTNGYMGSGGEGTSELKTSCYNGDTLVWSVVPIDPNDQVSITSFSGQAIPSMVNPAQYPQFNGTVWGGRVNQAGTNVQYTMSLLLAGSVHLSFDPFITAKNPTLAAK